MKIIKLLIHLLLNFLNIAHGQAICSIPDWAKNLNGAHKIEWINGIDNRFKYIECDICKTLYVEYRWKYIWDIMFGKEQK